MLLGKGQRESLCQIDLMGKPWVGNQREAVEANRLIGQLINQMEINHWKLVLITSLGGKSQVLLFKWDMNQCHLRDMATLTMGNQNTIRFVDFKDLKDVETFLKVQSTSYFGSNQFELSGFPFDCSGKEAEEAKKMMCQILEMLSQRGWKCLTSFKMMKNGKDKSSIIFKRSKPKQIKVISIFPNQTNQLSLINIPQSEIEIYLDIIKSNYQPGIKKLLSNDQIVLKGHPWSDRKCIGLHGKVLMMMLLEGLLTNGWNWMTSLDTSAVYDDKSDCISDPEAWFLYREA